MLFLDAISARFSSFVHGLFVLYSTLVLLIQTQLGFWNSSWTWHFWTRHVVNAQTNAPLVVGKIISIKNVYYLIPHLSELPRNTATTNALLGKCVWKEPLGSVHRVYISAENYYYPVLIPWGNVEGHRPPFFTSLTTVNRLRHSIRPPVISVRTTTPESSTSSASYNFMMMPAARVSTFHPEISFENLHMYCGTYQYEGFRFDAIFGHRLSTSTYPPNTVSDFEESLFGRYGILRVMNV